MKPMKTPGVYIVEKNAFPNSVVQVATAVPAFIGYTEKAMIGNTSVAGKPTRISSMSEFHANFGFGPKPIFSLKEATAPGEPLFSGSSATKTDPLPPATFSVMKRGKAKSYELTQESPAYALYGAMRLFFQNGGGACYIVSVGSYEDDIDADALMGGIAPLVKEAEPTLLVIPETTRLSRQNSQKVQQAMLMHCGEQMKNRFAVLDMFGGHLERQMPINDPVAAFRDDIGVNHLDFGAVYYPWVNTSIFDTRNFSFENIDPNARDLFMELLKGSANPERLPDEKVAPQLKEIARTDGVPKITGSAAVVTTKGARTVLTEKILKAEGYGLDDESLVFTLAMPGAADDAPAPTAAGRFALSPDEETAIASFTQAQLMAGEVVHIQDGDETEATLSVTVQQMNGDQPVGKPSAVTSLKVSVVLAEGDLAVLDGSSVEIDVLANDDGGADATSVKLVEADDDTGKTKTVDKVGIWTVDATTGKVTFAAAEGFAGPMAEVKYTVTVGGTESKPQEVKVYLGAIPEPQDDRPSSESVDKTLRVIAPVYGDMMNAIALRMNAIPPAAAMVGIYTMVDADRGVWKAPANVSLNSVTSPMVSISADEQEDLNVTPQGKSVNAIRPFVGEGTLVWGARTLDGNSLDWRYINVRRTMIMMEESIRLAAKAYVFEPNTANTWVTMQSMIENFLTGIWKQGGLAGAVPEDAFSVHVGLGETMTAVDILEGILRITVLVAVVRPAEFIEITFQQQMQKS